MKNDFKIVGINCGVKKYYSACQGDCDCKWRLHGYVLAHEEPIPLLCDICSSERVGGYALYQMLKKRNERIKIDKRMWELFDKYHNIHEGDLVRLIDYDNCLAVITERSVPCEFIDGKEISYAIKAKEKNKFNAYGDSPHYAWYDFSQLKKVQNLMDRFS